MTDEFVCEDFLEIKEEESRQSSRLALTLFDIVISPLGKPISEITILDVGCATGLYLRPFYEQGFKVHGFEPAFEEAFRAGLDIPPEHIMGTEFDGYYGADLTICLEVAEHIEEAKSLDFVQQLCSSSDLIVFSAAQPGQGGKGHINCQPKEYWENLFNHYGFELDVDSTKTITERMKQGYHMGWLVNNLMVFRATEDKIHSELVEEMNVDPETGGRKASKLSQIGFIDPQALMTLGEVAGMGTVKYDKYNYLKGFDWSLCYNAMQRHAQAAWGGEDLDQESGLPHFAHAAWHALALLSFYQRKIGNDDRLSMIIRDEGE